MDSPETGFGHVDAVSSEKVADGAIVRIATAERRREESDRQLCVTR
jgi:hypothetical protein